MEYILGLLALLLGGGFAYRKFFSSGRPSNEEDYRRRKKELDSKKEVLESVRQDARVDQDTIDREIEEVEKERRLLHENMVKEMREVNDDALEDLSDDELARLVGDLIAA